MKEKNKNKRIKCSREAGASRREEDWGPERGAGLPESRGGTSLYMGGRDLL